MYLTEQFAAFLADTDYDDLPEQVVKEANLSTVEREDWKFNEADKARSAARRSRAYILVHEHSSTGEQP